MSFIAYGELMGTANDQVDGAVVVLIDGAKGVSDKDSGYVKLALNRRRCKPRANGAKY